MKVRTAFWLLAVISAVVIVAGLVAMEKWRPWRGDLGENADGYFGPYVTRHDPLKFVRAAGK